MDIRNTARGAWLGMAAGLLIAMTGAVRAAAAEDKQPTAKVAALKAAVEKGSAVGAVGKENRAPAESGVDKAETEEKKAKRLENQRKAKEIQAAGLRMDLDNLKAFQEREKARITAEKAKRTPQETPAINDGKAAK